MPTASVYRIYILLWIIKTYTCSLDLVTTDIVFVDLFVENSHHQRTLYSCLIFYRSYRQFTYWVYEKPGPKNRITMPSWVQQSIRNSYPEEDGVYEGYHEII